MKTTFPNEVEYICRQVTMCKNFKNGVCTDRLSPYQCQRSLKAVSKLKERLVLGNEGSSRMTYEDVRVCHDIIK